jgi:release factor glutamine methyltransferase
MSPVALATAAVNISKHGLEDRIQLWEGDLLDAIPSDQPNFDIILSNPPYISEDEFQALSKDVREHEPKMALVSGPTGMEVTERLLAQAASRLNEGGVVMLESSPMLVPRIEQHLQILEQWELKSTIKDLAGHARIIIAERMR